MPSLSGSQRDIDRFTVSDFTDQNNLRRLPERSAQSSRVGIKIGAQFTLVEGSLLMRVNEFNRVFKRDNVHSVCLVHNIQYRRKRGRFTGPGGAGYQYQSVFSTASWARTGKS